MLLTIDISCWYSIAIGDTFDISFCYVDYSFCMTVYICMCVCVCVCVCVVAGELYVWNTKDCTDGSDHQTRAGKTQPAAVALMSVGVGGGGGKRHFKVNPL